MMRLRWSCSDFVHHEHRWKWSAWLFDLFTEHTSHGGEIVFRHSDGAEEKLKILG
jgi:hypothetical protein